MIHEFEDDALEAALQALEVEFAGFAVELEFDAPTAADLEALARAIAE